MNVLDRRRCGVLLHVSSLPTSTDEGPLGQSAHDFVDLLAASGFSVWHTLPIGPVDQHLSPYQLSSAFAGNPLWLHPTESAGADEGQFSKFIKDEAHWLRAFAAFSILSRVFEQRPWWEWPEEWRAGCAATIDAVAMNYREPMGKIMMEQFLFFLRWSEVRRYANDRGVLLFGDLPLYLDANSADVWSNRQYFRVSAQGDLEAIAGVPPDYFNEEGQRWGNPLFDWAALEKDDFDWWVKRVAHQLRLFDLLRLDHFRGLDEYWEIPADAASAREGRWQQAPGQALLAALRDRIPDFPLVAEDLGTITPSVRQLRDEFDLPGMLVLQFAFDGSPDNPYLPANHVVNAVVYTGTHDNDTTLGWYEGLEPNTKDYVSQCLGNYDDVPLALITAAYESTANLCILPLQDLLGLGADARMNRPGEIEDNWRWRFQWEEIPADFRQRWYAMAEQSGRLAR